MRNTIPIALWALMLGQAAAAETPKFAPPDLQFEYQLHRDYVRRQRTPAVQAGGERMEDYRLQNGETLRSLSEILYGDPSYWPRVWSEGHNRVTGKSHLVRPGHTLEFLLGSEDQAPAFRFTENADPTASAREPEPEAGPRFAAAAGSNPIVEIPPPDTPPKPVLQIPPSFPEWQAVFKGNASEVLDDRNLGKLQEKVPDRIWLTAYVQETPVTSIGTFLENDSEAALPVVNQYVFVKLKRGIGREGQKLLVVRDEGRVKRVNRQWRADEDAYLIRISAELEITEEVPAKFTRERDAEEFVTYRALVTRSTGLSIKGCELILGQMRTVDLEAKGAHGTTVAQIIGSEKHAASTLYGPGDIIFLNRGSNDGLEEGQLLDIFVDRTTRHDETPVVYSPAPSGLIKVVKVTGHLATGVLLEAREGVQQGDQVREISGRHGDDESKRMSNRSTEEDEFDAAPDSGGGDEDSGDIEDDLGDEIDEM